MRLRTLFAIGVLSLSSLRGFAQGLPADVRPNHWAADSVRIALQSKVLAVSKDKAFHGEAKVTKTEAVIAIASLARLLEANQWKAKPSQAIPAKADKLAEQTEWRSQPLTRYAFARLLTRSADLFTNGVQRASAASKDRGKSVKIPPKPALKLASAHPAYASVLYLATHRMLYSDSPFLAPDDKPVQASEAAKGLAQVLMGLVDANTDMGKDADGNTIDRSFHKKP